MPRSKGDLVAIKVSTVPINSLIPYARNARTHSDAQVAQIAASIREFGWTNPVHCRIGSSEILRHDRGSLGKIHGERGHP